MYTKTIKNNEGFEWVIVVKHNIMDLSEWLVLPDQGLKPWPTTLETSTLTITPPVQLYNGFLFYG